MFYIFKISILYLYKMCVELVFTYMSSDFWRVLGRSFCQIYFFCASESETLLYRVIPLSYVSCTWNFGKLLNISAQFLKIYTMILSCDCPRKEIDATTFSKLIWPGIFFQEAYFWTSGTQTITGSGYYELIHTNTLWFYCHR